VDKVISECTNSRVAGYQVGKQIGKEKGNGIQQKVEYANQESRKRAK
jgi:hypothetical protein